MIVKKKPGRPEVRDEDRYGWAAVTSRIHRNARAAGATLDDITAALKVEERTWWNYRNAKNAEPPGAARLLALATKRGWHHPEDRFNDFLLTGELDPPTRAEAKKMQQEAKSAEKWAEQALQALGELNALPSGTLPLETSLQLLTAGQEFQRRLKEQSEFESQIAAARGY